MAEQDPTKDQIPTWDDTEDVIPVWDETEDVSTPEKKNLVGTSSQYGSQGLQGAQALPSSKPTRATPLEGLGGQPVFDNGYKANSANYETKLSQSEEVEFQKWLSKQNKLGNITNGDYKHYQDKGYGYNYDFRAAFKESGKSAINETDNQPHWGDIGKKPNHPTFSDESKYSGVDGYVGGSWNGEEFTPPSNKRQSNVPLSIEQPLQAARTLPQEKPESAISKYEKAQSQLSELTSLANNAKPRMHSSGVTLKDNSEYERLQSQIKNIRSSVSEIQPEIDKAVNGMLSEIDNDLKSFTTKDISGLPIADTEKAAEFARKKAVELGLPEDGYAWKYIWNKAKDHAAFKIVEPEVNKEFAKSYERMFGKPLEEDRKDIAERIGGISERVAKADAEIDSFAKQQLEEANQLAEQELVKRLGGLPPEQYVVQAKATYDQSIAAINQTFSGRITPEGFAGSEEEYKVYKSQIDQIERKYDEAAKTLTESAVAAEYGANRRYNRNVQEYADGVYRGLNQEIEQKLKPADAFIQNRIRDAYKDAYGKVAENNEWLKTSLDRNVGSHLTRPIQSAVGGGLKAIGTITGSEDMQVYGDYIQDRYNIGSAEIEEWSDWFTDYRKVLRSTGQLIGSMSTSMVPAVAVGLVTGGLGAAPTYAALAGGSVAFLGETTDLAGRMYDQTFAETGDAGLATERAKKVFDGQMYLAPAYAFQMIPYVGKFSGGVVKKFLKGAAMEYATETFLQEYPQNAIEKAIMDDAELSEVYKYMSFADLNHTMKNTVGVIPMGGFGQVNQHYAEEQAKQSNLEKNIKSIAAKAALGKVTEAQAQETILNIVANHGVRTADAVISTAFNGNEITYEQASVLLSDVKTAEEYVKGASELGLSDQNAYVFTNLRMKLREAERQAENEQDPAMKSIKSKRASKLKKDMEDMFNGGETRYTTLTFPNGTFQILTYDEARKKMKEQGFGQTFVDGELKFEAFGNESEVIQQELKGVLEGVKPAPKTETTPKKEATPKEPTVKESLTVEEKPVAEKPKKEKAETAPPKEETAPVVSIAIGKPTLELSTPENPFDKRLVELGYEKSDIDKMTMEQKQEIVSNKTQASKSEDSAKVNSVKENAKQQRLAEMNAELDDEAKPSPTEQPFLESLGGTPVKGPSETMVEGVFQTEVDGVDVLMSEVDGNTVKLESIRTPKSKRGQGKAKAALKKITDEADKQGKAIVLDVVPEGKSTTEEGLRKLYGQAGFVPDGGKRMRREAKESKQETKQKEDGLPKRLSQEEEQGRAESGELNAQATDVIGGIQRADKADKPTAEEQEKAVTEFATKEVKSEKVSESESNKGKAEKLSPEQIAELEDRSKAEEEATRKQEEEFIKEMDAYEEEQRKTLEGTSKDHINTIIHSELTKLNPQDFKAMGWDLRMLKDDKKYYSEFVNFDDKGPTDIEDAVAQMSEKAGVEITPDNVLTYIQDRVRERAIGVDTYGKKEKGKSVKKKSVSEIRKEKQDEASNLWNKIKNDLNKQGIAFDPKNEADNAAQMFSDLMKLAKIELDLAKMTVKEFVENVSREYGAKYRSVAFKAWKIASQTMQDVPHGEYRKSVQAARKEAEAELRAVIKEVRKEERKKTTEAKKETTKAKKTPDQKSKDKYATKGFRIGEALGKLAGEIRGKAEGRKEGRKDAAKMQKEFAKGVESMLSEMIAEAKKSAPNLTVSARQFSAATKRLLAVNFDNPKSMSKAVDYVERVLNDAVYLEKITDITNAQNNARKRKHPAFHSAVRDFLSIKAENIPDDMLDDYMEALDALTQKVPSYSKVQEMYYQVQGVMAELKKEVSHPSYEILENKAEELWDEISSIEIEDIDSYKKLMSKISKWKRSAEKLLADESITDEQYDDLMSEMGSNLSDLEGKYASEIYSLKTDKILEIEGNIKSIGLLNMNEEYKAVLGSLYELSNDDLRNLTFDELIDLNSILEMAQENGFVDIFRLTPIVYRAIGRSSAPGVVTQINKAPKIEEQEEVKGKIARRDASFWESVLGLGFDKVGAYYKNLVSPILRASASHINFTSKARERFVELKNKYGIDKRTIANRVLGKSSSSQMDRIGMFMFYLREHALTFDSKNKGAKDKDGNPLGSRDWFDQIIKESLASYPTGQQEKLVSAWESLSGGQKINPSDVFESFSNNDTKFLTKNEMSFLKEMIEWNDANITGKQMAANEMRGNEFEQLLFHIHRVRISTGGAIDVSAPFATTGKGRAKIKSDAGKKVTTEEVGPIQFNYEQLWDRNLDMTSRDYFYTPALIRYNATMSAIRSAFPKGRNDILDVTAWNIQEALNNEFKPSTANKVVRNILKAKAMQVFLSVPRTINELAASIISYPARAGVSYRKAFKNFLAEKDMVRSVLEYTDSTLRNKENLQKYFEVEKGSVKEKGKIETLVYAAAGFPEHVLLRPIWFTAFEQEFESITGNKFDANRFKSSDSYRKANRKAIMDSGAFADNRYEIIAGAATGFGARRRASVAPDKLAKILGFKGSDIDVKTTSGMISTYMTGYVNRELIQTIEAISEIPKNIKEGEYNKASSNLKVSLGVLSALFTYGYLSQVNYLMKGMLLADDDDEKEEAKEELKRLATPEGAIKELTTGTMSVLATKYNAFGRSYMKAVGSLVYNLTDDKEVKADMKRLIRELTYQNPYDLDSWGDRKANIYRTVGESVAAMSSAIDNLAQTIGFSKDVESIYTKIESGDKLTDSESELLLAIRLSISGFNSVAQFFGGSIPNTSFNKFVDYYVAENGKAQDSETELKAARKAKTNAQETAEDNILKMVSEKNKGEFIDLDDAGEFDKEVEIALTEAHGEDWTKAQFNNMQNAIVDRHNIEVLKSKDKDLYELVANKTETGVVDGEVVAARLFGEKLKEIPPAYLKNLEVVLSPTEFEKMKDYFGKLKKDQ